MIKLLRTHIHHPKFHKLVQQLDAELHAMYGTKMEFFGQYNVLKEDTFALVVLQEEEPIGIGAFRVLENSAEVEIKRMYVSLAHRGKGISKLILQGLEDWARENKYTYAKLETGEKNLAAIALYQKTGYKSIKPFGPYAVRKDSFCFGKKLA